MESPKQDPISDFAARLARLSDAIGQSELARRSGVSQQVISLYATGRNRPSLEHAVLLADAAGVTLSWLATGKGEKPVHIHNHVTVTGSRGVTIAGRDVRSSEPVARALKRPKRGLEQTRKWREIILSEIRRHAEQNLAMTEQQLCEHAERIVNRPVITLDKLGDREIAQLYESLLKLRRPALK